MNASDWVVLAAGAAAIAWVNWYFFLAARRTTPAAAEAGRGPGVTIVVRGGYEPATVHARRGAPLTLRFDRQERAGCSEEVVFPAFGIRKFLPAFETTTIELPPAAPGRYEFTCGMSMLRGTVVVD